MIFDPQRVGLARPADAAPGRDAGLADALARSHRGDPSAWRRLDAARRAMADRGDSSGELVATGALLICGQIDSNFRGFEAGIEALQALRSGSAGLLGEDELLALGGLVLGLLMLRPDDPFLDAGVARMTALIESDVEPNLALAAARIVLYYTEPRELRALALRVASLVEPRTQDPRLTAFRHAHWLWFWRRCAGYAKDPLAGERAEAALRRLALQPELGDVRFLLAILDVEAAMPAADIARAARAVESAEALAVAGRLRDDLLLEMARTRLARMRGEADAALLHASRASAIAAELNCPPPMRAVYLVNEAQARLLVEDFAGARALMTQALPLVAAGYAREVAEMMQGVAAYEMARFGDPVGLATLRDYWRGLRERQFYDSFEGYPEFCARLCALALEHGIEVEFVCSLVARQRLATPPDAPRDWPWPLRICALGGFSVERGGELLGIEGKAQRKPIALLQAVIAHGATRPERGVEVQTLIDALWPDIDAADPRSSFEVALSRLRKWLGVEGALRLTEGRLALDPQVAWCDVAAFEAAVAAMQRCLVAHADASPLPVLASRTMALYRGALFGGGAAARWSVVARERLAQQFARAVCDYGRHLETGLRWGDAQRIYEQALERDMLAEPVHRALLVCLIAQGRGAEATRAFERCCSVLEAALGTPPSPQTVALMARLGSPLRSGAPSHAR